MSSASAPLHSRISPELRKITPEPAIGSENAASPMSSTSMTVWPKAKNASANSGSDSSANQRSGRDAKLAIVLITIRSSSTL